MRCEIVAVQNQIHFILFFSRKEAESVEWGNGVYKLYMYIHNFAYIHDYV